MKDLGVKVVAGLVLAVVLGAGSLWTASKAGSGDVALLQQRVEITDQRVAALMTEHAAFKAKVLEKLELLVVEVTKLTARQKPGGPAATPPPSPQPPETPDTVEPPPEVPDEEVIERIEHVRREVERLVREREEQKK